jgi:hypothetical protein
MPKTRTIVAINNPKTGEPLAAGAEVELDDEAYRELRDSGKVEASEEEVKAHATPEAQGNYGARTGRGDVADKAPEEPTPVNAPEPSEDDEDKRTTRRR